MEGDGAATEPPIRGANHNAAAFHRVRQFRKLGDRVYPSRDSRCQPGVVARSVTRPAS